MNVMYIPWFFCQWSEVRGGDKRYANMAFQEVMVIREGKPIKESLRGNIFEAEIGKIIERETHHTLLLTDVGQGVIFEADIPNYVLRNLKLVENQRVRAALRRQSLLVIPGRDSSPAVGCD